MVRKMIAGVGFVIKDDLNRILQEYNSSSEAFIISDAVPLPEHLIRIQISNPDPPLFKHQKPLFDADDAWRIYKDERFFWIVLHPTGYAEPIWVARFEHDFSRGRVFCGKPLTHIPDSHAIIYNPVSYPLDQILMMNYLPGIGGLLVHAAGVEVNSAGWMFAGKSGAGKSTISDLIMRQSGAACLSDDRIAVRNIRDEFFMYGTPWPGDAGYAVNTSVPLKGMFFLRKGRKNTIRRLDPSDTIARLMPVASIPWYDREKVEQTLDFCDVLIRAIPMYELTFVPDSTVVDLLLEFINESQ